MTDDLTYDPAETDSTVINSPGNRAARSEPEIVEQKFIDPHTGEIRTTRVQILKRGRQRPAAK
ncbi:MAG: hypothetical protein ACK5Q5_18985 [Planctomycetaceae bacterium]